MAYLPRRIHQKVREAESIDLVTEPIGEARAAAPEVVSDVGATLQAMDDALSRVTAGFLMSAVGQGEEDQPETPEAELLSAETRARVERALSGLPEREQALVRGFYFDGRQFDEVAKELGISKSWASRLHAKALDLLRDVLVEVEDS
jgi:RNA polymerase sigma factor for flagellar operon FliA